MISPTVLARRVLLVWFLVAVRAQKRRLEALRKLRAGRRDDWRAAVRRHVYL